MNRRCNTRGLAGKPIGRVSYYAKQTYYSRIRRDSVCNTFHKPIITSIIDVKKITACGESGFPTGFLGFALAGSGWRRQWYFGFLFNQL